MNLRLVLLSTHQGIVGINLALFIFSYFRYDFSHMRLDAISQPHDSLLGKLQRGESPVSNGGPGPHKSHRHAEPYIHG